MYSLHHSHLVIDDSISLSRPQIPCLSCVCKLRPDLILICPPPPAARSPAPNHARSCSAGTARRAVIGCRGPGWRGRGPMAGRYGMARYHEGCRDPRLGWAGWARPGDERLRERKPPGWWLGWAGLCWAGLGRWQPNHVKSDYALIRVLLRAAQVRTLHDIVNSHQS